MQRRDFLRVIGAAAIMAAQTDQLFAQSPVQGTPANDPAAPWRMAGLDQPDLRRQALSYAILAPNPHNRQPWLVDLATPDVVLLYCDPKRLLPMTDPLSRQIMIGLGNFIETFVIAAAQAGRGVEVKLFPNGYHEDAVDERPVARMTLTGTTAPDPLFAHILTRRSTKTPYDMNKALPREAIDAITSAPRTRLDAIQIVTEPTAVAAMRGFMERGGLIEVTTPRAWMESVDLMRIGQAEITANPDGISVGGPMVESLVAAGRISRSMMADTSSPAFRAGTERYTASTAATPSAIWYSTEANLRTDQIEAGRAWMRIALAATAHGISLHPMSQVLQEFPEMSKELAAFHDYVGVKAPARVQMLARIGYGPVVNPTPRWPLETRIAAS